MQHNIGHNIETLRGRIEKACLKSRRDVSEVKLIAVAKNFDACVVRAAFDCGLRDFGENRVQEAAGKYGELADVRGQLTLHYIGHLQSNKAGDALQIVDIIHSVDSVRLAGLLSAKAGGQVPVFLQVNLAGEQTKYGFSREALDEAVESMAGLPHIRILGLMTIAPVYADAEQARPLFAALRGLNSAYGFKELSMGMTDDFEVAVEEGATMIRIGRAIFGERS
ncbi:MAG: YggS family pyridoxal phosphate-dependent enzyme [Dehalococcoidia bacterium]